MSFLAWTLLAGLVLLSMALASAYLRRLPVSSAMVYLALGVAIGPRGAGWLRFDALATTHWLERLTEVVVIISLFVGGLRLRLPPTDPAWRAAYRLAGPVMVLCIAGVALVARYALGMDTASAILLGAILAPTDPVLAGEVSVAGATDRDRLRYGLSGEAGLNDGAAFPFVVLSLGLYEHGGRAGAWVFSWALSRVLWAVPAGLAIGYVLGLVLARLAIRLRARTREADAPSDFLALALIALAYVAAEAAHAWGFLAVFAAGLGLRRAEVHTVKQTPPPAELMADVPTPPREAGETPAEELVERQLDEHAYAHPAVASGATVSEVLSFGDAVERILEVVAVLLVGVLASAHWDWRALPLAAALFLAIRPAAAAACLAGTATDARQRMLMGWFGIRGIGSLYYLAYAMGHAARGPYARDLAGLTLSVVAVSIVVHGATATPLLARYERALRAREGGDRGGRRAGDP